MGQNLERLGRLQLNRGNIGVSIVRTAQTLQRTIAETATDSVAASVKKAARTDGFEGELGTAIQGRLSKLHAEVENFREYQSKLGIAINAANQALDDASGSASNLPEAALSPEQQQTVNMATLTNSPVQVSPGVTMTPAEASKFYLDQIEEAREEKARALNAALDKRLQEIIQGMPTSEYEPEKPRPKDEDETGGGGDPSGGYPGPVSGTPPTIGSGNQDQGGNPQVKGGHQISVITHPDPGVCGPRPPVVHTTPEPPVLPPLPPRPPVDPSGPPTIDGGTGTLPGGTGGVGPGGLGGVGGVGGAGGVSGSVAGGAVGQVGGAGLVAGGVAGRVGGSGVVGRVGGVGGVGAAGGASGLGGAGGAAGAAGAQGGAGGGRGGMVAGAGAGGAGAAGGGSKKNRRRGQELFAFDVEPEDGPAPDLGDAGAAGRAVSDEREELGW